MGTRVVLDATSTQSSTATNIRRFIRETELSDHIDNRSTSTAQTSTQDEGSIVNPTAEYNGGSIMRKASQRLNSISEEPLKNEVATLDQRVDESEDEVAADMAKPSQPSLHLRKHSYQDKLKYLPNRNFEVEVSGLDLANTYSVTNSIPNTFKYKSHPNAKTKASLGAEVIRKFDEKTSTVLEDEDEDVNRGASHLSSDRSHELQGRLEQFNTTPDWMPPELNEKWMPSNREEGVEHEILGADSEFGSSVRVFKSKSSNQDNSSNFKIPSTNTIVHNSNTGVRTPMWKKAKNEFQSNKRPQFNLQNIFLENNEREDDEAPQNKDASENHSLSSTLSTPFGTVSHTQGIQNQLTQLSHFQREMDQEKLAGASGEPESPLKLFGDKYNTFTKEKLNDLLFKMNNKSSNIKESEQKTDENKRNIEVPKPPEVKLKIKNFTQSGSYTEQQFLQNANNIFKNIQKRGYINKAENEYENRAKTLSTATSTPIAEKQYREPHNEYFENQYSFSSDYLERDSSTSQARKQHEMLQTDSNGYTFENSSKTNSIVLAQDGPSEPLNDQLRDHESSYTYDEFSDEDNTLGKVNSHFDLSIPEQNKDGHQYQSTNNDYDRINSRLDELEKLMKDVNEKLSTLGQHEAKHGNRKADVSIEQNEPHEVSIDQADLTREDYSEIQDFIRWKKASQLKLLSERQTSQQNAMRESNRGSKTARGHVKPDLHLPTEYENMVLDTKNQRWIFNDKENSPGGSLDSIDDLIVDSNEQSFSLLPSEKKRELTSYDAMSNEQRNRNSNKAEVSFQIPTQADNSRNRGYINGNVTQISQLNDVTFSQTQRKLVSVITDVLSEKTNEGIDWKQIHKVSLSNCSIDSVNDLDKLLPNLSDVDLSANHIKYLDGLPLAVMNLNLSNNCVENITSFAKYRDLQVLDVSLNSLTNLSGLDRNIHLSELNLSTNSLTSINGIKNLHNLVRLNVSGNDLMGELDFKQFNLIKLEELNLSENSLQEVRGLEYLTNLRILNLNENHLTNLSCKMKHQHLKKILLKFNNLKKLNLESYPYLRVLRIDGNSLNVVTDIKKLKNLDEVSCKSQLSFQVIGNVFEGARDIQTLDLSGNYQINFPQYLDDLVKDIQMKPFLNLTHLSLAAMSLSLIPESFANIFPNVRDLNLNFNALRNINGLSKLKNIKKLHLVSNNISKTEIIVTGLLGSRQSLKVLDVRLNPCTIELYPYVFNPQELDLTNIQNTDASPIHLESLDDIESFGIHYQSLSKSSDNWISRDAQFFADLAKQRSSKRIRKRLDYETLIVNFFISLKRFDGGIITKEKRVALKARLNLKEMHSYN
ncbi:uncharacterized protein PRCAT00004653001 [Priceomyces carsonii]|uniref:uncharacterized protein n=1 Tax=Priceomyces carsonii TaxID=28549 RepID=UPI002ED84785|nr:unnamed protein product [Priceomyces carsonii]